MDQHEWLWKWKFSEMSHGETESSSSISSHSEKFSDDEEAFKAKTASANRDDPKDSVKSLTEKLSAALANVSAKEGLVKQHTKVAEEAITGWEKAQNEVEALQKKLEHPTRSSPETEALVREISALKVDLEIRTIERDLCNQAAETASKQNLESVKKVVKLESECRRLEIIASKSSVNHKTTSVSSNYVESSMNCTNSWASALIAELDQLKNEKFSDRSLQASSIEITIMDDFLEIESLAALPDTKSEERCFESKAIIKQCDDAESSLRAELYSMEMEKAELQKKFENIEMEKAKLEIALTRSQESLEASELLIKETKLKFTELQKEMEMETQMMSAKINLIEAEVERERNLATESKQLLESQQIANPNVETTIKQEDLAVAAGNLAECQKTIASLGEQLDSLATIEDFLTDTGSMTEFSSIGMRAGGEPWTFHSNETFLPRTVDDYAESSANKL